jgi:hypothetical protein
MRTAVYDTIKSLQPYFFSLREIGTMGPEPLVSLDIKIPISWKADDVDNRLTIKEQDKNENFKLLSIVAPNTKEGYDSIFTAGKKIIKTNLEEEEKIKLFNEKVEELKTLFLSSSLDKLKGISFDKKDGLRDTKGSGEIELGDSKG